MNQTWINCNHAWKSTICLNISRNEFNFLHWQFHTGSLIQFPMTNLIDPVRYTMVSFGIITDPGIHQTVIERHVHVLFR